MKRITLCLLGTLVCATTLGQDPNSIARSLEAFRSDVEKHADPKMPDADHYSGTPFFNDEWQEATIELVGGEKYNYAAKYFVYADQFWIKNEKDAVISLILSNEYQYIQLGEHRFEYVSYLSGNKLKSGLAESMYSNKSQLYKVYTCTLQKGQEAKGYQERVKDSFKMKTALYYRIGENPAQLLPQSKKELFSIFGDKSAAMERLFNSRKMKIKNETDMIELFIQFDTL